MTAAALTGDALNLAVFAASAIYAGMVLYYTQDGKAGVLDEGWKEDGFCVQNKDIPFWSSFDTCLYVDTAFFVVIMGLFAAWRKIPGMECAGEYVPGGALGTLGRGFAHGAMAMKFRDRDTDDAPTQLQDHPWYHIVLFWALFWTPLLKAAIPKLPITHIAALAAAVVYFGSFLAPQYGFMYVQTILNIGATLGQLLKSRKEKDTREYVTFPMIAAPSLVIAYSEALYCGAFLKDWGGHFLYDASICGAFLLFYIDAYLHHSSKSTKKVKSI